MSKKETLRHELKFVIGLQQGADFFNACMPYCSTDSYAGDFQSYEVASLYYDTDDLRFYRDREESVGYRRKVRLRSYNINGSSVAGFLEIKEKHKGKGTKKRAKLNTLNFLVNAEEDKLFTLNECLNYADDCQATRELQYLNSRLNLNPILIVRYIRRTLVSNFENTLRITVDQRLTTGGVSMTQYKPNREKFFLAPNLVVLEIKSDDQIPLWLQSLLLKFEFSRIRYSKYCDAVKCLGGFLELSKSDVFSSSLNSYEIS